MELRDISNEETSLYTLAKNEEVVFFLLNRSDSLTFELTGENAKAHIFALFIDKDTPHTVNVTQQHTARNTTSQMTVRSVLDGTASLAYTGLIHITKDGGGSNASQESRALLLSKDAKHSAIPALEILPRDVICHHKASASPLNSESLYYLESRGLSRTESMRMLINGFIETSFEQMSDLGVSEDTLKPLREKTFDKILSLYV